MNTIANGKFVDINPAFLDLFEYSKEERNMDVPFIMKPPDLEDELWPIVKEKLGIA